ncbi:GntR family transcriptional regulator [Kineosporia babensis]|uniref:GntR family transcriptional regulator n=1 Tax=Kineosporia babensis TaxID=499548 RepID=A0A9X1NA23_9ACTN|nr:GntR family transcriptional regulator [Kineosporia babensis]MCD5309900.1 GntR family transcriptional regulator [Kineosporia babensis]
MPVDPALSSLVIDRASPVPLYFQLAQHLEQAIDSGRLAPNTMLANEIQLADQIGLSRPTVRRAMQYLVDKGLLVRRRGVGTRVVQPRVRRPLELTSLYDDLAAGGRSPQTRVLSNTVEPVRPDIAEILSLPAGTPVVSLVRLRSADGRPIARLTNHLVGNLPGLSTPALEQHGLYALLRGAGVILQAAQQSIGARTATAAEARLLEEAKGAALLTMNRLTFDERGRAVEYGTHIYVAARHSFELSLLTHRGSSRPGRT